MTASQLANRAGLRSGIALWATLCRDVEAMAMLRCGSTPPGAAPRRHPRPRRPSRRLRRRRAGRRSVVRRRRHHRRRPARRHAGCRLLQTGPAKFRAAREARAISCRRNTQILPGIDPVGRFVDQTHAAPPARRRLISRSRRSNRPYARGPPARAAYTRYNADSRCAATRVIRSIFERAVPESMQLDVRFGAPRDETRDRVERCLPEAVQR